MTGPVHLCTISTPFEIQEGEHTVLQPFRRIERIVHIAISVQPGTHLHLSQVKHVRVKCLAQGHTIETMSQLRGGEHDISPKILPEVGFETAQQAATFAKLHAPTIAPRHSLRE